MDFSFYTVKRFLKGLKTLVIKALHLSQYYPECTDSQKPLKDLSWVHGSTQYVTLSIQPDFASLATSLSPVKKISDDGGSAFNTFFIFQLLLFCSLIMILPNNNINHIDLWALLSTFLPDKNEFNGIILKV